MLSFLVLYATGEGQTATVAARISDALVGLGHETTVVDVAAVPIDLDVSDYDGVLVGSSIHVGSHAATVTDFVRAVRPALTDRPTAFFQVCLSSAVDDPARAAEAAGYVDDFLAETGWTPDLTTSFAGAVRYSQYGFIKRAMMKRIVKDATGDTDTSRDYEYTDWDAVERFATDFADLVEREAADVPGAYDRDPHPDRDDERAAEGDEPEATEAD